MENKIILVGYFKEVHELVLKCGYGVAGVIDPNPKVCHSSGILYLGSDRDAEKILKEYINYSIVITPDLPLVREKLYKHYSQFTSKFASLISPNATISSSAKVGRGVVIQDNVFVSSDAIIGDFSKLNVNSNIMHDTYIGDFTTIAPNAVLLGRVTINSRCYIGSNSTILPNLEVGERAVIGAGSVVTKFVSNNCTVAGNPSKILKKG